ncbi:MAG: N-acetylglucosamine-6-phosphate deacetylase [Ardenticatenaceae bacterium]|nr:N-acetylglucosamine-6-phosphate deacetylase [Ardenticatenaceae bacterium]
MLCIQQATIITPDSVLEDGDVLVANGRIQTIAPTTQLAIPAEAEIINAAGHYLVPGFIDMQCNGGFGLDFTHDPRTIWEVAARLPQYGVTAFLPTIITSPLSTMALAQQVMGQRPSTFTGSEPLGLHLEGPFLNSAKKGAHNPIHLQLPPTPEMLDWSPETAVALVTLAPELPGALELAAALIKRGLIVSAGHSMSSYEEANSGIAAGIRYATHLFNAMPPLHHRQPGLLGAVLADERVTIGLIADGVHIHPTLVKLIWQAVGPRLNIVTDAMAALGMPPGQYQIGDQTVTVSEQQAQLADGTLAGCIVPLDAALRNLMAFTGCSLAEALPTITTIPARLLGLAQHKGQIAPGFDADLVLLTADYHVQTTIINGKIYQ